MGRLNWLSTRRCTAGRPRRTLAIVANINSHVDRLLRLQMALVDGKRKSRREHGAMMRPAGGGRERPCPC